MPSASTSGVKDWPYETLLFGTTSPAERMTTTSHFCPCLFFLFK